MEGPENSENQNSNPMKGTYSYDISAQFTDGSEFYLNFEATYDQAVLEWDKFLVHGDIRNISAAWLSCGDHTVRSYGA